MSFVINEKACILPMPMYGNVCSVFDPIGNWLGTQLLLKVGQLSMVIKSEIKLALEHNSQQ